MASNISEAAIKAVLSPQISAAFEIHDSIASTNVRAKELAKAGAADFTVIISDHQSAGHGRFGREFFSPEGAGIYMSIILRPNIEAESIANITSFTAVAVANAIESLCSCSVGIKWVNDLFLNGRKICGILAEASTDVISKKLNYVVIGIGIDVLHADTPDDLKGIISSIEDQTGVQIDRNELIGAILNEFYDLPAALAASAYMDEYRARSVILGKTVKVTQANETFDAIARHIDDSAALIVEQDGILRKINAGEVSIRF